jgi:hypothetical protein
LSNTSTITEIYSGLRSPVIMQSVGTLERQLPKNTTLSVTFTNSRGVHELRSRNINAPLPGTYNPLVPNSGVRPYGTAGNIYLYESSGLFKQNQVITNVNTRFNSKISLFGYYAFGLANSNTDGVGTFPSNQYDLSTEWGRANFNVRHRGLISGSINAPYGVRLSPFITMNSGAPLNITAGSDLNGDSIANDRPAFMPSGFSGPSCVLPIKPTSPVCTLHGYIPNPTPGMVIIPRNYGQAPGSFTVNMRLSRTWGFGEKAGGAAAANQGDDPQAAQRRQQMAAGGGPGGPGGGRGGPGGGGGGPRGGGGGGPRGGGGGGGEGGGSGPGRYNLTLSLNARNLFNHVNPGTPFSNLTSPSYGLSNSLGGGGFGGGQTANRRIDLSLRFSF